MFANIYNLPSTPPSIVMLSVVTAALFSLLVLLGICFVRFGNQGQSSK